MLYPEVSAEPELLGVWGWEERKGMVDLCPSQDFPLPGAGSELDDRAGWGLTNPEGVWKEVVCWKCDAW